MKAEQTIDEFVKEVKENSLLDQRGIEEALRVFEANWRIANANDPETYPPSPESDLWWQLFYFNQANIDLPDNNPSNSFIGIH